MQVAEATRLSEVLAGAGYLPWSDLAHAERVEWDDRAAEQFNRDKEADHPRHH